MKPRPDRTTLPTRVRGAVCPGLLAAVLLAATATAGGPLAAAPAPAAQGGSDAAAAPEGSPPASAELEAASGPGSGDVRSEDVRYANVDLPLAAELLLPVAEGPVPGAVILQGSGDSDRGNPWARSIARELTAAGLAVLLTDKRGSGESGGDWRTAGFGDLAGDALAGVQLLAARPEVDSERVGLVGLSQGGWVAPLAAAARPEEVAFVVDLSGAAVTFAEQSFVEMANTARQAGLTGEQVEEVLELNRLAARYLLTQDWDRYAAARERGLAGSWAPIAEGFPASQEEPRWTFLRRVASFDPIPYWVQVTQPVLVVYGGEDEADNVPVAESVRRLEFAFAAAGKGDYEIVVVPGAGHDLRDPESGDLHPALTTALSAWLREHVKAPAAGGSPPAEPASPSPDAEGAGSGGDPTRP